MKHNYVLPRKRPVDSEPRSAKPIHNLFAAVFSDQVWMQLGDDSADATEDDVADELKFRAFDIDNHERGPHSFVNVGVAQGGNLDFLGASYPSQGRGGPELLSYMQDR